MITAQITIANLRCNGCVNTITKGLMAINGVEEVAVDLEKDEVTINHLETISKHQLITTLLAMGYPEATAENGLLTKLKSVTSCLIGKVSG